MPTINQALISDTSEIALFIEHASLSHRHLDWTPLFDWIHENPFLIYKQDNNIDGILACPPDPDQVAWIKCFACSSKNDSQVIFSSLLCEAKNDLSHRVNHLYALGLNDWFKQLLEANQFDIYQEVVVLSYNSKTFNTMPMCKATIRPMELHDIDEVARVDYLSFEPIWSISHKGLQAAFFQSEHASVAEFEDKIVGYELSTANQYSAHLARVAVLPQFQHEQIGYHLVDEMIRSFHQRGIHEITVNTQNTNHVSLKLYQKIGFNPTGDRFQIYRIEV